MATLDEIKKLYYKATEEARLCEPNWTYPGPPCYSTEDFSRWARKVDIYRLGEGAADFALEKHEEIISAFGSYRHDVADKLSRLFRFYGVSLPGQLRDIGSCWDGSKVGAVNEMDSLYVLQGDNFTVLETDKETGLYRVYLWKSSTRIEIEPRVLRDQFAQQLGELISEVELPHCLHHGGYNSARRFHPQHPISGSAGISGHSTAADLKLGLLHSGYSGVRYNGPAVTSQFLSEDSTHLLTWDVTPAIVLPHSSQHHVREALRRSMRMIIVENPDKMFPLSDIHLIPDVIENFWRLSTAQAEADTLRILSREAPMKTALSFSKVLAKWLNDWNDNIATVTTFPVDIDSEITQVLAAPESEKTQAELAILNQKMRFAHIWIPDSKRKEYHEDKKGTVAINNAAVKHILLKAACKRKGAFAAMENMEIVIKLMQDAFEALANGETYSSEHAFLPGIKIWHFSVSAILGQRKLGLARDVREQCCILLREAMTEVTYIMK